MKKKTTKKKAPTLQRKVVKPTRADYGLDNTDVLGGTVEGQTRGMADDDNEEANLRVVERMPKALKQRAANMNRHEIRLLVDTYYQYQKVRLATENRIRALEKGSDLEPETAPKPDKHSTILAWLHSNETTLEEQMAGALTYYSQRHPICQWMQQFKGVGGIISSGLVAHLDITKAPTAGHFWNYAGLNPTQIWREGEVRPWNASLKTICYKLGESFVKAQGATPEGKTAKKNRFYADQFTERKRMEVERNDSGYFAEAARRYAATDRYKPTTEAWHWVNGCYPAGTTMELQRRKFGSTDERLEWMKATRGAPGSGLPMLSPDHVHSIARRWVVKLFLSHLHQHWFESEFDVPAPRPYSIDILGHAHMIPVPGV